MAFFTGLTAGNAGVGNKLTFIKNQSGIYTFQKPTEFVPNKSTGFIHRPSSKVHHIKRTEDKVIFDATYTFDKFSRRKSPLESASRDRFLILYGCSFVYGNGLNDDQTLNYYLAKHTEQYSPYNYAIGASGPHMMLALIRNTPFKKQLSQTKGHFIYIFLNAHIQRANGFMNEREWLRNTPWYEYDDERDRMIRAGTFASAKPIETWTYHQLQELHNILGIRRNFPSIEQEDIGYTCRLIEQSKKDFLTIYPESKFTLYVHPFIPLNKRLEKCLKAKGVAVLKSKLKPNDPNLWSIEGDGHPTAYTNNLIAKEIAEYVE